MKYAFLLALVLGGCIDAQADTDRASARYKGQPIEAVSDVWGEPVSESRNANGPVYTYSGSSASAENSTSTTLGFIGNTPISATTSTNVPITIYCRVRVFTDSNRRVIGLKADGANGASSSMFKRLQHQ